MPSPSRCAASSSSSSSSRSPIDDSSSSCVVLFPPFMLLRPFPLALIFLLTAVHTFLLWSILPVTTINTTDSIIITIMSDNENETVEEECEQCSVEDHGSSTAWRYKPYRKHVELFGNVFQPEWIHSDFKQIIQIIQKDEQLKQQVWSNMQNNDNKEKADLNKSEQQQQQQQQQPIKLQQQLEQWLRTEIPGGDASNGNGNNGVYSFQCLTDEFIQLFQEEIQHFYEIAERYHIPIRRPNSMNNYGVIINEIGMRSLITNLQQTYIWPVARYLFPIQGSSFHDHHSFLVRYQVNEDLGLDMHVDDSDVTFNVCLGGDNSSSSSDGDATTTTTTTTPGFTGATLVFCGMFGSSNHRHETHIYHHEIGRAIIHLGLRRHGATNIKSGIRTNLIIWNQNHQYRNSNIYQQRQSMKYYHRESSKPDLICLSYTHDRDYITYKELPSKVKKAGEPYHPGWCPPPGREYPGYYTNNNIDDDNNNNDDDNNDHGQRDTKVPKLDQDNEKDL